MLLCRHSTSSLCSSLLLFLGYISFSVEVIYQESLNVEDLESLFGEELCIEGSFSVTESGDPVISGSYHSHVGFQHIPQFSKTKTQENNETVSDKSPMSLIYELAEFNKINVQFTLIDEKGPAHKKQFVVSLKLGEEEYVGEAGSKKKAQHEVSRLALNSTLYGHPPKQIKKNIVFENKKTPVEKLESWARKHSSATIKYSYFEQTQLIEEGPHRNYYHSGMYSKSKNIHKVQVKIGSKAFSGEGSNLENAKQNAAIRALESLQNIDGFCMLTDKEKSFFNKVFNSNSDNDSPISLVYEFGMISNMPVSFDLYSEEGPAHIKKYVFRCNVGNTFETFGEGSSKKSAKKEAAEAMIKDLKRHATFNNINCIETPKRSKSKKKKSRNLINSVVKTYSEDEEVDHNTEFTVPEELDPISKLFQIQQAKHELLPVFTSLEKSNNQFSIEVAVNGLTAIGTGPNKKTAKKEAAEAMLKQLGYSSANKKDQNFSMKKKEDFSEGKETSMKKKLAPGINLDSNKFHKVENMKSAQNDDKTIKSKNKDVSTLKSKDKLGNLNAPESKDSLKNKDSRKPQEKPQSQKKTVPSSSKSQLLNLSHQLGFKFQFSDFPKVNNSGFVSLVSLTTDPPQVCYGVGETTEFAQDKAALSALGTLYKSQLDHISRVLREENSDSPMKTQITMIVEDNAVRTGDVRETD